jgi:hypothetical protein
MPIGGTHDRKLEVLATTVTKLAPDAGGPGDRLGWLGSTSMACRLLALRAAGGACTV